MEAAGEALKSSTDLEQAGALVTADNCGYQNRFISLSKWAYTSNSSWSLSAFSLVQGCILFLQLPTPWTEQLLAPLATKHTDGH